MDNTESNPNQPDLNQTDLNQTDPNRTRLLWGLGAGAALLVAIAIPVLILLPQRSSSQVPEEVQAHREQVAEIILATDREALVGDSPSRGQPDAPLILLKFSDFQCPYCATSARDMKTFMDNHEADILYVYKHLPLTQIHPEAMPAAQATWAAQQQGQFWAYHDALFAQQDRLGEDLYVETAQNLGLDMAQFNRDRTSPAARAAVEKDLELAQKLQITGTPTFILNDLLLPGNVPLEFFEEVIEKVSQGSTE